MIRFRRIYDSITEIEKRKIEEICRLFEEVFPLEKEYAAKIPEYLENKADLDFEVILLVGENGRGQTLAFGLAFYFTSLRFAYLDYIGSRPDKKSSGAGGALYEAMREHLAARKARGLFLEAPPDDPERITDKKRVLSNQARIRFYERFGAFPILGTKWNDPPVPKDYDPTWLLYDPLGRPARLRRRDARLAVQEILRARHGLSENDPITKEIVKSFKDDPVRLRPPRYEDAGIEMKPLHGKFRPLVVVYTEHHEIHHVKERGFVERPARVSAIMQALTKLPIERVQAKTMSEKPLREIHDPDFLHFLARAAATLEPDESIYPQIFPVRRPDRKPREKAMRAGYYCSDTFTPLSKNAYRAARAAANCALTGAQLLAAGERLVYALCRPPGHHAEKRIYGGFCYINNAAAAAHQLSKLGRTALLDLDYHHGNGSQEIFYNRSDVFTASIHGHPTEHYPYFAGYADERGKDEGLGFNLNCPVRNSPGDDGYLEILDKVLKTVMKFGPKRLVLSLGFDIMRGDPTGNFGVTARGMRGIGEALGRLHVPMLIVQEGGYSVRNLHRGSQAFFTGLLNAFNTTSKAEAKILKS